MKASRLRLSVWTVVLLGLTGLGIYSAFVRFGEGLGASTNLSDAFPWGIWIGFDVLVGVGLAAGGFTIAATVHVFQLERFKPIARPAVFTAFIGYLLVVIGLLFDLGQPWDIWHPLVMWNPRSVMFEVAWCVMLYTGVLALEFSPIVLERFNLQRPLRIVRKLYLPLVVVGVLLSMLHQSSLGTLYVIVPDKLYGLWYTPLLPVFFFLSAIAAGLAMTIVESYLSHRAFGRELEHDLLEAIARVIVVVLAVYGVWKAEDLAIRGNLALGARLTPESVMFWGEMGLGVLLPMGMMASARLRSRRQPLFYAALLTVMGFIVGRLNVAVTGMARASGESYFPSLHEFGITAALVAFGFAAFAFAARHLALFPKETHHSPPPRTSQPASSHARTPSMPPSASGWGIAGLWLLLAAGVGLFFLAQPAAGKNDTAQRTTQKRPAAAGKKMAPPELSQLPAEAVLPTGEDSPGPVTFRHEDHVDAENPTCVGCHRAGFSFLKKGTPLEGPLSMERIRKGELCGRCHNGEKSFGIVEDECGMCHAEE